MAQISLHTSNAFAVRSVNEANHNSQKSIKKLSTGKRINKAGDDVADISVAAKLDSKLRSFDKAVQNLTDGLSYIDSVDTYVSMAEDVFQNLHEITIQARSGTNSEDELAALQRGFNQQIARLDHRDFIGNLPKKITKHWDGRSISDPNFDPIFQGISDSDTYQIFLDDNVAPNQGVQIQAKDSGGFGRANEDGPAGRSILNTT